MTAATTLRSRQLRSPAATLRAFRSWTRRPAIHPSDGSVSYALEWNDYKFVFGGDTFPNKWFIEHAKDADLAIHECMMLPQGGVYEGIRKVYDLQPPKKN